MSPALTEDLIDKFGHHLRDNNMSSSTQRNYKGDLMAFLDWLDEYPDMDELDSLCRAWLTHDSVDLAPSTVRRRLASVRVYGRWVGAGVLADGYKAPPRDPEAGHKPIPGGMVGVKSLLAAARDADEYLVVVLCAYMGLRINEAVTVQGADVDQKDRTLRIKGKGSKKRILPLTDTTYPIVGGAAMRVGFGSETLVGLANRTARNRVTELGELAGLERRISSHDLRATFATDMWERIRDILAIQKWMGHASYKTTLGYIERDIDVMRAAGL